MKLPAQKLFQQSRVSIHSQYYVHPLDQNLPQNLLEYCNMWFMLGWCHELHSGWWCFHGSSMRSDWVGFVVGFVYSWNSFRSCYIIPNLIILFDSSLNIQLWWLQINIDIGFMIGDCIIDIKIFVLLFSLCISSFSNSSIFQSTAYHFPKEHLK